MTLNEFFSMGGYATYVWSAYGICSVVLILNVIQPLMRERKTIRELQKRLQSQKNKQAG
jgi:heme exporter protein D